jgi:hypothetical protein
MSDDIQERPDLADGRTYWNIRRGGKLVADYGSAKGRLFSVGDQVVLPPPLPRGSLWTVVAVELPETDGFNGTLVLEPANPDAPLGHDERVS